MGLAITLLYILFVLAAIVLIVVILLQEGKGGGFGQALGEHGQATFGVGASGINRFTGWAAAVFLASALGIHVLTRYEMSTTLLDAPGSVPMDPLIQIPAEDQGAPGSPQQPGDE